MRSLYSWWQAYLPPLWLGGQGLSLLILTHFLFSQSLLSVSSFSLVCFIFSSYLFDSLGLFSPEDKINQPGRFYYFKSRKHKAIGVISASLLLGFILGWQKWLTAKVLFACLAVMILITLYMVFRLKEKAWLKPVIVSLAWIIMIFAFSESQGVSGDHLEIFYLGLFGLLVLDSLWLDIKDRVGDREFGIRMSLIRKRPVLTMTLLHLALGVAIVAFPFKGAVFLLLSHLILWLCGVCGQWPQVSRWAYGLMIPIWSYCCAIAIFIVSANFFAS